MIMDVPVVRVDAVDRCFAKGRYLALQTMKYMSNTELSNQRTINIRVIAHVWKKRIGRTKG